MTLSSTLSNLAFQASIFIVLAIPPVFFTLLMLLRAVRGYRRKMCRREGRITVGFFHPYCNAGGGGERVLWCAIRALQTKYPQVDCIVYTGDTDATEQQILERASERLGVEPIREVEFVFLHSRSWVEASKYPVFTLLGQSLGSLILGWEALRKFVPDIYIDSMGYAFTLPLFKYGGGCKVAAYVHYPTISSDMLGKVESMESTYNNSKIVTQYRFLSKAKVVYYILFAWIYGKAGSCCDVIMVNSSWTKGHVSLIWKCKEVYTVYPPCDVTQFSKLSLKKNKNKHIISIGQFRPEKDHQLQLRSFHKFYSNIVPSKRSAYKLLLVGGCRNKGDEMRVEALKKLAEELEISDAVEFHLNVSFDVLKETLSQSTIGIHTMWNEHFGIGVVELMAGGTVVLAHKSGGPKMDIVTEEPEDKRTGYLADDVDSYSKCMTDIFKLSDAERKHICLRARESCQRFDEETFDLKFLQSMSDLINQSIMQK